MQREPTSQVPDVSTLADADFWCEQDNLTLANVLDHIALNGSIGGRREYGRVPFDPRRGTRDAARRLDRTADRMLH